MKRIKTIITLLLLSMLWVWTGCGAPSSQPRKRVMLYSFELMHNRAHYEINAMLSDYKKVFDEEHYELFFCFRSTEDSLRLQVLSDSLKHMADAGRPCDVVLTYADQDARELAETEDSLLRQIPIIYIGVQAPQAIPQLTERTNMTGMVAEVNFRKAMDLAYATGAELWMSTNLEDNPLDSVLRSYIGPQMSDTALYRFNADRGHPLPTNLFLRDTMQHVLIPVSIDNPHSNFYNEEMERQRKGFSRKGTFNARASRITFLKARDDVHSVSIFHCSLGRFYTLTPIGFNLEVPSYASTCVGGYFTPMDVMMEEVRPLVDSVCAGYRPADLTVGHHHADNWIDWREIYEPGMFAEDLPDDINYVNLPWQHRNRTLFWLYDYGWLKLLLVLLSIVMIAVFYSYFSRQLHSARLIRQARKAELEQRYTMASLAMSEIFFWRCRNGYIELDEVACKRLGYATDRLPIEHMLSLVTDDDIRIEITRMLQDIKENESSKRLVVPTYNPETQARHVLQINFGTGRIEGQLIPMGTFSVLDERIRQQQEVRDSYKAEEESQLRETYLASMGHEIRTPLNAILGFSRILIDQRGQMSREQQQECVDMIVSNQQQLLDLMNDVKNYSDQNQQMRKNLTRIKVSQLMDELYKTHSVLVPKHLEFRMERGHDIDRILVSRTNIRQIISNLMNNACKFTSTGSITLGWRSAGDRVQIYVRDTGIGMTPEDLEHVFSLYFKRDATTEGGGIGLSLCTRLAKAMGGELSATSEFGKGSEFVIELPKV